MKQFIEITQQDGTKRHIQIVDIEWFDDNPGHTRVVMKNRLEYKLHESVSAADFAAMINGG